LLDSKNQDKYSKILEINSTEYYDKYKYLMNNEQRLCCLNNDLIYFEDLSFDDYAIDIYDLTGKRIKRIEKQTRKIACSDKFKEKVKEIDKINPNVKVIADYMKHILSMSIDKNGNIWIKPAVEGLEFDHQYFDIFNPNGIFMKRIKFSLPDSFKWHRATVHVKIVRKNIHQLKNIPAYPPEKALNHGQHKPYSFERRICFPTDP
jgi:hypothetical protein